MFRDILYDPRLIIDAVNIARYLDCPTFDINHQVPALVLNVAFSFRQKHSTVGGFVKITNQVSEVCVSVEVSDI